LETIFKLVYTQLALLVALFLTSLQCLSKKQN